MYDGQPSDIIDNGYVIVDFESGTHAILELCMFTEGSRYQEGVSVVDPKDKIEALVPGRGRFWPAHLGDAPIPQLIVSPRNPSGPQVREIPVAPTLLEAGDHNGSTFYQHEGFLALVRGERKQADVTF
ncbi:MAG: myo-inositol 2-dehydrogenase/D-chiro-inositol 1-dehydrogenase [Ascidiaceihabitans sp.]|jgi:myo-inositol 2-dehydrogenase/D-chiro-inositol 1-dehydrogenase|tara:strand:- start:8723 stop:9106 length:384 start_codon:yes stop_codon:yes gene_type:complete